MTFKDFCRHLNYICKLSKIIINPAGLCTSECRVLLNYSNFSHPSRGMAGHSHWKNVKATKEANDMAKQNIINKIALRIQIAVKGN